MLGLGLSLVSLAARPGGLGGPASGGGGGGGSPEFVQMVSKADPSSASPLAITLTSPATAGSLLVYVVWYGSVSGNNVIPKPDSDDPAWTERARSGNTAAGHNMVIWTKTATGGETGATANFTSATTKQGTLYEYTGVTTIVGKASVIDASNTVSLLDINPADGFLAGDVVITCVGVGNTVTLWQFTANATQDFLQTFSLYGRTTAPSNDFSITSSWSTARAVTAAAIGLR